MKILENYQIKRVENGTVELYDFEYEASHGKITILAVFRHGRGEKKTEGIAPEEFFASLGAAGTEVKSHVLKICGRQEGIG